MITFTFIPPPCYNNIILWCSMLWLVSWWIISLFFCLVLPWSYLSHTSSPSVDISLRSGLVSFNLYSCVFFLGSFGNLSLLLENYWKLLAHALQIIYLWPYSVGFSILLHAVPAFRLAPCQKLPPFWSDILSFYWYHFPAVVTIFLRFSPWSLVSFLFYIFLSIVRIFWFVAPGLATCFTRKHYWWVL